MQGYNVIMVFNPEADRLLMCRRTKEPYKGLMNLVGGKIEPGESGQAAAYRELFEETGILGSDIVLHHLMDMTYHMAGCYIEVYAGRLRRDQQVHGEENPLLWLDVEENFFDIERFAGEGNIGHMMEIVKINRQVLFEESRRM